MVLESILIGAMGGAISFLGNEIYKKINPSKKGETPEDMIKSDVWEDIWLYNDVKVKYEGEIKTPILIETTVIENGIKYLFKCPIGISSETMSKCKTQIKELSNSDDVQIAHYKSDLVYVVSTKNIVEEKSSVSKEIEDENIKWTEFWTKTKKGSGDKESGFTYPQLIDINEWESGKEYIFSMPIGISTFNINQVDTTIKEWLGASRIDITSPSKSTMKIKSYLKELPGLVKYEKLPRIKRDELEAVIGKTHTGWKRLRLLSGTHNLFCGGGVGTGKSVAINTIITDLALNYNPRELEMWIVDLKIVEMNHFKKLKHVKQYGITVEEMMSMIDELVKIMWDRYKKMDELGVKKISSYNKVVPKEEQLPYILFVVEEIYEFSTSKVALGSNSGKGGKGKKNEEEKENYIDKLAMLLSKCRGAGIGAIISSQRLVNAYIPKNVSANLMTRLGFKVADSRESDLLTDGRYDATKLRGKGHGVLIDSEIEDFQGTFLDEDNGEITYLLNKHNLLKK